MILVIAFVVVAGAALGAGFFLGWTIGRRRQEADKEDIKRHKAYRENAQKDFDSIRSLADEIIDRANTIGARAGKAEKTVEPTQAALPRFEPSIPQPDNVFTIRSDTA
jgi:hypothetical protein